MSATLFRKAIRKLFDDGGVALARSSYAYLRSEVWSEDHPFERRAQVNDDLFKKNGLNVCHNKNIPEAYDPEQKNVLVAIESPGVVENEGWLDDSMEFHAEISFGNFYELENYYCPRTLYVTNDNYVDLDPSRAYKDKDESVSMVYSQSRELPGHEIRHEVADELDGVVDIYGSGHGEFTDRFWSEVHQTHIERKATSLANHRFQVVIENVKHPNYVSEKFYDSLKTHTVPIYRGGAESVRKMGFDTDGVIFFETVEELRSIVETLSPEQYREMRPAVERNRERLVELRRENRFQFVLNSVMHGYMHSVESYHQRNYDELALEFE